MPALTIETITPKVAEQLLLLNTANRPIRKSRVALYASEMKAGRWMFTGEPIILNGDSLLNGQHRLLACVQSDTPFMTAVFRDAPTEIYQVIDTGLGRTAADVLKHEGISHYSLTAAAARLVLGYESNTIHDNMAMQLTSSRPLILAEVTGHRVQYDEAAVAAWEARKEGYNTSAFCAFRVLLGRVAGEDEAREWIDTAISGVGLEVGDPRLALRRWVIGIHGGTAPIHLSAWIRARNSYIKSESRTLIKSWFKGTPFPRITG